MWLIASFGVGVFVGVKFRDKILGVFGKDEKPKRKKPGPKPKEEPKEDTTKTNG